MANPPPSPERGTYDETKIGQPTRDKIRSKIGDTGKIKDENGETIWLLSDVEIDALIGGYPRSRPGRINLATADAADMLVTEYAQNPDVYTDEQGVRIEWKSRILVWQNLAMEQRAEATTQKSAHMGSTFLMGEMAGPDLSALRF